MRGAKSKEETLSRSPEETVELILPSEIDSATQIEQVVEQMALRAGFDEDAASSIAMATREAAINAVKHGNKLATDKSVSATLNRTGSSLTVKITDQGEGLDPEAIPDPLDANNLLRPSGRGVLLMRAIMDEVHFRQLGPGTEATLIKYKKDGG